MATTLTTSYQQIASSSDSPSVGMTGFRIYAKYSNYNVSSKSATVSIKLETVGASGRSEWNSAGTITGSINGTTVISQSSGSTVITGDYTWEGSTTVSYGSSNNPSFTVSGSFNVINSYSVSGTVTLPVVYYLDLNGLLDSTNSGNITGYGTADIYINGTRVSTGVTDWYSAYLSGTTYEITNIAATTGHTYNGVSAGSLSGTITAATSVRLSFSTNSYTITYSANGGSGAPSATTYKYGSGTALSTTVPTRTNYRFNGWLINGTLYQAGATIPTTWAANYTATAQWTATADLTPKFMVTDWTRNSSNGVVITMNVTNYAGSTLYFTVDGGSQQSVTITSGSASTRTVTFTLSTSVLALTAAHKLIFYGTGTNSVVGRTYLEIPKFEGGSIKFYSTGVMYSNCILEGVGPKFNKGGATFAKEFVETAGSKPVIKDSQMIVAQIIETDS